MVLTTPSTMTAWPTPTRSPLTTWPAPTRSRPFFLLDGPGRCSSSPLFTPIPTLSQPMPAHTPVPHSSIICLSTHPTPPPLCGSPTTAPSSDPSPPVATNPASHSLSQHASRLASFMAQSYHRCPCPTPSSLASTNPPSPPIGPRPHTPDSLSSFAQILITLVHFPTPRP